MAGPGTLDLNAAPGGTLALDAAGALPAPATGLLDFTGPPDGVLAFGAGSGPGTPDEYTVAIDADVGALDTSITAYSGRAVAIDADIGALDADIALRWDANVSRGPRHLARSAWQDAAGAARAIAHRWQGSTPIIVPAAAHWQDGAPAAAGIAAHWQGSTPINVARASAWQDATPRRAAAAIHWQGSTGRRASLAAHWQDPAGVRHQARVHYQEMQRLRHAVAPRWQDPARARRLLREVLLDATPARHLARTHWQDARRPPPGRSWHELPVQPPHLCYDPAELGVLDLGLREDAGLGVLAFWCRDNDGPQPGGIVVARRRSYIVINNIEVRLASDGTLLPALDSGFSMRLDHRSWTWGFTVSLHAAALPLLTPGPDGLPVELEVTVNGQPFRMLAESRRRSVQFPRAVLEVSGAGKAALLDAPYAPAQNFSQPGFITAQQLMLDVLTVGGVSMGWTLDWQITDWPIMAGAWSHQGSWISAVNDIAAAVGAYVQPHDTAQTLRILPRYPVRAWELASATPDITLPAGIATVEEVTWLHKPDYDAIYLQGEPGDKLYHRKRAGTPGTNPAPQAVHPLLVHADAAAQRAIAELSDTGRQIEQRLQLMVLPATGVIKPGTLLRYTDDAAVQRTGIVRATEVRQAGPRIEQTLTVQAHE